VKLVRYILANRDPPKTLFVNERDHVFFKRYVSPKIKMLGKEVKTHYDYYRKPVYRVYSLDIHLSPNKALLAITPSFYRYVNGFRELYYRLDFRPFLVYVDSNGKVGIIESSGAIDNVADIVDSLKINEYFSIHLHENDRDLDRYHEYDSELITLDKEGWHRVQGDIIIEVIFVYPYREEKLSRYFIIYSETEMSLYINLINYAYLLLLDRISRALTELGYTVMFNNRRNMLIVNNIMSKNTYDDHEKSRKILNLIVDKIDELTNIHIFKYTTYTHTIHAVIHGEEFRKFNLLFSIDYNSRLSTFDLVIVPENIIINDIKESRIIKILANEFLDQVDNTPRQDYEFIIGNHHVKIENAYHLAFQYQPSLRPLQLPSRDLIVGADVYFVDNDTNISLYHVEHGVVNVRFTKPSVIRFTNVEVNREYILARNRIVTDLLYKSVK
jgi:hypothetical protein